VSSRESQVAKSRELIRIVHLEGTHGENLRAREKSRKGRVHEILEFGISGVSRTRSQSISASKTLKSREAIRTVHHRRTRGGDLSIREISQKESYLSALRDSKNQES
jgi:hypothetical protein